MISNEFRLVQDAYVRKKTVAKLRSYDHKIDSVCKARMLSSKDILFDVQRHMVRNNQDGWQIVLKRYNNTIRLTLFGRNMKKLCDNTWIYDFHAKEVKVWNETMCQAQNVPVSEIVKSYIEAYYPECNPHKLIKRETFLKPLAMRANS